MQHILRLPPQKRRFALDFIKHFCTWLSQRPD
jgi:hypothetical protein